MASRAERRAALQRDPTGADAAAFALTEETPMKIQFASVTLHKTMPRLDAGKGQATATTTFFDAEKAGVSIELDTAAQLVRIAKGYDCRYVPLAGVEWFGPTLDDAKAFAGEKAKDAAARAKAEAAAAEAAAQ